MEKGGSKRGTSEDRKGVVQPQSTVQMYELRSSFWGPKVQLTLQIGLWWRSLWMTGECVWASGLILDAAETERRRQWHSTVTVGDAKTVIYEVPLDKDSTSPNSAALQIKSPIVSVWTTVCPHISKASLFSKSVYSDMALSRKHQRWWMGFRF